MPQNQNQDRNLITKFNDSLIYENNYYEKWLIATDFTNPDELERQKKLYPLFINAFSQFISSFNNDYRYNKTYLGAFYDDFIGLSKKLQIKIILLNKIVKYQSMMKQFELIKNLEISIDNIIKYNYSIIDENNVSKEKTENSNVKNSQISYFDDIHLSSNLPKSKCLSNTINVRYVAELIDNDLKYIAMYKADLSKKGKSNFILKDLGAKKFLEKIEPHGYMAKIIEDNK